MTDAAGAGEVAAAGDAGRIIAIDVLRGLAILWVVLFHLWVDIKFLPLPTAWYYEQLWYRVRDSEWSRLPTSLSDIVLRDGYQGVPLFMMLSGMALYLSAVRRPRALSIASASAFYRARLQKILLPYWFGVALFMFVVCAVALYNAQRHGGGFVYQYHHVTFTGVTPVAPGWGEAFAAVAIVPRAFSAEWRFASPVGLWFVVLILQYYLLFPVLRPLLDRVGPWWFSLAGLTVTVVAKSVLLYNVGALIWQPAEHMAQSTSVFRVFEFTLGMSLGWLFAHRRALLEEYAGAPFDIAGVLFIGLLLHTGGSLIDDRYGYFNALADSMIVLGLTLMVLPLIVKAPGRLEATAPLRLLAWTGPISYAVLIASEPLRLITGLLRGEAAAGPGWWAFLALYVPVSLALAWPIARIFGLTAPGAKLAADPAVRAVPVAPARDSGA